MYSNNSRSSKKSFDDEKELQIGTIGKSKTKHKQSHISTESLPSVNPDWIKSMDKKELEKKFKQAMESMNINYDDKKFKEETMRQIVISHYARQQHQDVSSFVEELENPNLDLKRRETLLRETAVTLRSSPLESIEKFKNLGGLSTVLKQMENVYSRSFQDFENYKPILLECLKALKSYSNNKIGLTDVLNNDEAINLICRAVDPHDANCMLEAVRLISVFCIVPPSGHRKVLAGLTDCSMTTKKPRFTPIIEGLTLKPENATLTTVCLQLINCLITYAEDLDFRVHLRNEFYRYGLREYMDTAEKKIDCYHKDIQTQIQGFVGVRNEDAEDYATRAQGVMEELKYPFVDFYD
ncbi:DgyrCDS5951 [Dimorphilus gyrociliatus]|uniref:DgyrCDS5951 n=1 Tax=Dimorphilus gyrociliatus TaxID=2664684 RepID=A0A7I8VPB6_9ANNE|nr:DgyrCDS5951 [Dimorphilus gyrociliatus]